ncbi:uncharacterized protein LOC128557614 [Mercenaria mercenaria]|uniref:uncharacterized protein LOC128557614 n=1 Tax=Mercenaria mercenaria TaxID=6596 RepID=UPI00234E55F0|nr:uncharacterized protein LOC128557614 [Mercenaria mercenaria]
MAIRTITCKVLAALVVVCGFCLNLSHQLCTLSDTNTIICDNIVPVILPSNVTSVYIHIFSVNINFDASSFSHESWRNVTFLDITGEYKNEYDHINITFGSMCFAPLYALKQLRIHGDEIETISLDAFDKVEHLLELEFSECIFLDINSVIAALFNANFTVETLSLKDVSSANVEKLSINELFGHLLQNLNVTSLSLRKTMFKINRLEKIKVTNLKTLDISQTIMWLPPCQVAIPTLYDMYAYVLEGLKTVNISSIPVKFFLPDNDFLNDRIIRKCDELRERSIQVLFLRVENLYSNELFQTPVIINDTLLNISDCHFNLKKWHFKGNRLKYFNISIYLPMNNELTEVDFSNNEIKYINPLVLQNAKELAVIKLRSNELFHMETLSDFNDLSRPFPL